LQAATEINKRTGKKVFTFDMFYTVGEGYMKHGTEFRTTTNVTAVFDDVGRIKTLYPNLQPLP
jgi:hypothetical protein